MKDSQIEIFHFDNGKKEMQVMLDSDTVWLSKKQMAELFDKDSDTIGLHLKNIYESSELDEIGTSEKYSVVQNEGGRNINRKIKYYNLDAIISVGYRVNSKKGVLFRIWASRVLKEYLLKGYVLNEKEILLKNEKLIALQKTVKNLSNILSYKDLTLDESNGLLKIISDYAYALDILDQYDNQKLKVTDTSGKEIYQLTYNEAIKQIRIIRDKFEKSKLFGNEKDDSLKSSVSTIYQTFDGVDLYPSIEEKAANLLYFVTKNHSFSDGNKRIAAFLF